MKRFLSGKAIVATLCMLIGGLSAALWWKAHAAQPSGLVLSTVEQGTIQAALFTSGNLAYRDQARLSAEVVAKVAQIHVKEGQAVVPGQLLIKLDDSTVRAEIAQFDAQFARSMIDVRRLEHELDN
jgi:HlyD family secretion protein